MHQHITEKIIILDFGSQYTQLIGRRIRELGVFSEICPYNIKLEQLLAHHPKGIILSGGPSSVYAEKAPLLSFLLSEINIPILGICYGLQLIAFVSNGQVDKGSHREYGKATLQISESPLFQGVANNSIVWMSHGDLLTKVPEGYSIIATSENSPVCAIQNLEKNIFGVQFHPEVNHSLEGPKILANFVLTICSCQNTWNTKDFIQKAVHSIKLEVGDYHVICAVSGGVDSTVLAALLHKSIGDQLHCLHIDNGMMRLEESKLLMELFKQNLEMNVDLVDASDIFLNNLAGAKEPEQKRKIIGKTFIDIFEQEAKKLESAKFLAQGTLYPDVIESVSTKGPSAVIKSHHNVGGLPEKMGLKLLEPFKELFKDEVRKIGIELGVPIWFIERHPFPGPGLGVRVLEEVTRERIAILQRADAIYIDILKEHRLYNDIWQAFAVLLTSKSVGVMGDERTYDNTCALRAVTSVDGMTADWYPMPYDVLAKISNRIINEVRGINRVVYDITSKPPGTIEWE